MKSLVRCFGFLCLFCAAAANGFSLDREAFTFTNYDLSARIEPDQQRLGVRGKITLRNDSSTPQKIAVLQISSSLTWRSIQAGGAQLQFVAQPYTSDIDHTGALSEAVVTLPEAVAPKSTVSLDIAYEGMILLDATRLTRIGTPDAAARSSDWDQIATKFTAVRGAGCVTWYPIATESADLAEDNNVFDTLDRWQTREATSTMRLQVTVPGNDEGEGEKPEVLVNASACPVAHETQHQFEADCNYRSLGQVTPTFVMANYDVVDRTSIAVHFLRGHDASAGNYADAAEKILPLIADWFGPLRAKAETADLPDQEAAPFESGALLLTPLTALDSKSAGIVAAHQLTHAAFPSPRPWIYEGLAHFAQALSLEQRSGRQSALDYMGGHSSALRLIEKAAGNSPPGDTASRSLINAAEPELYRGKAMFVWWMLRDMLGDQPLKKALAAYRPDQDKDKDPSYLPRLIQAQTQRDLEWFFDDWVYRDRGMPDFQIDSAFARKTLPEGYLLTVTVSNAGMAGAEVPLVVKFAGGEISKRLEVRAKGKAVIRVQLPKAPEEVIVNDGSVPESDVKNNIFMIETEPAK